MDWRLAIEEERAALKRIVALLFALAGLAELAGGRSWAVREFVLWLLRYAEAAAWDFVIGAPEMQPQSMLPTDPARGRRAGAIRLAARFRALALLLDRRVRLALASRGETKLPLSGWMQAMPRLLNALSMLPGVVGCAPHPAPAPDTS